MKKIKITKNLENALKFVGIEMPMCSYEMEETSKLMDEALREDGRSDIEIQMLSRACAEIERIADFYFIKEMENVVKILA